MSSKMNMLNKEVFGLVLEQWLWHNGRGVVTWAAVNIDIDL